MLDRSLLQDIGFVRGTGWDHEVWVYAGMFWIHFGDYDRNWWPSSNTHVNGDEISRKEMLELLLNAIRDECYQSTSY